MTNKGRVNLYLDKVDLKRLRKIANQQDDSPSRIIRRLVKEYIKKVESHEKKKHGNI